MATLSVIIPVFNTESYLCECLESVVNQTFQDIEIICVNDGSTDNSYEILKTYANKDDRIKIINQENKGQSAARNNGLSLASGKYITFIDSDDYLDLNAYEVALSSIENVDVVCFGVQVFGSADTKQNMADNEYYKIKFKGTLELNDAIRFETDCSVCNKIFKRDIIDKYEINFPVGIHYEDAEFYFKYISVISKAYFLDKYFYHYRRRNNSIMSSTFNGCEYTIEHLYIVEHLYNFLSANNLFKIREKLFVQLFVAFYNFAYYRAPEIYREEVFLLGKKYVYTFPISKKYMNRTLQILKTGRVKDFGETPLTFLEFIFSIKNNSRKTHKVITILGISIKVRRNKPKVSVVIPVYNTEKYLRECLDSVINQTLKDIEIICVNDGSTDGSLEILNEYASKNKFIKVISYKNNMGGGFARNKALSIARGEYLAFIDSDDIYIENTLEQIYLKCKNLDADIGICSVEGFDTNTKEKIKMPWGLRTELLPSKDLLSAEDIYYCIFNFSQNWNWNKIFKRKFIINNKIKFQNIYRTNDLLFTCKALTLAKKITILDKSLVLYRTGHRTNCQSTNSCYPFDFYKAFKALADWLVCNKYWQKTKASYTEWAMAGCAYNINSIEDKDLKAKVADLVFSKGLRELNLQEYEKYHIAEPYFHKEFDKLFHQYQKINSKK